MSNNGYKLISDNRKSRYLYEILEEYEAGIQLTGTEVKSIRAGRINLRDGFAQIKNGEIFLFNVHTTPQPNVGRYFNQEPLRKRKLLLHQREIRKLIGLTEQKGLTLIPLKLYLKRGWVKVSLGLARGKKLHDKREDLKKKQDKRDMERMLKHSNR